MRIFTQVILTAGLAGFATGAEAALEVCNESQFVQSVTLGYEGDNGWMSKGWWNIDPGDCAIVVGGSLQKRYYYIRAEVNGGDFGGEGYMFCTIPEEFEIIGDTDCESRGYESESFREIDTGETATDFTYTLAGGPGETPPAGGEGPGTGTVELGLTICNASLDVQSVSIGYEKDGTFLSEGWWNIDPDDCAKVIAGKLDKRYYYYRAEVNAGAFEGEGYMFCTSPEVYSIEGDSNCESRGYDSESFAEIDTGPAAQGFTFTISADGATPAPPPRVDTPPLGDDRPPVTPGGGSGLRICNETDYVQSVTIGFEGPQDWTSKGWWNIEPGECTIPTIDGETRRYLFYRAESSGGEFAGENYFFCITSEPFVIVGDGNCGARGYDRAAFREIDTGGTDELYTLTLREEEIFGSGATPEDDRLDFPSDDGPGDGTAPDTPVFDFDLPGDDDAPDAPGTDMTATDPDAGPGDATPPADDPFADSPPADTPPAQDTPAVTDTPPADDPPAAEPPAADPPVADPPAEEDERRKPPRRGGSRGG